MDTGFLLTQIAQGGARQRHLCFSESATQHGRVLCCSMFAGLAVFDAREALNLQDQEVDFGAPEHIAAWHRDGGLVRWTRRVGLAALRAYFCGPGHALVSWETDELTSEVRARAAAVSAPLKSRRTPSRSSHSRRYYPAMTVSHFSSMSPGSSINPKRRKRARCASNRARA